MAIHDYVIDNQNGANTRSDLNNLFSAVVSNNSNTSEPTTTYAFQWWADTTSGDLKIRNSANSAWITIGAMDTTGFGLMSSSAIGSTVQAYDADTAKTDTAQTFTASQRGEITTLTSATTVTPDFAASNNYTLTLGHNVTMANPTNLTAGQSGSIFAVQDGTGSRTMAFGSYWDFAGGTAPTMTTTASAIDRIDYVVRSTTSIHAIVTLALS